MGVQLFTNGASSTLSGTLSQGGTTMTLAAGTGSKFPSITGSDFFLITLFTKDVGGVEQNIEVVKATARVGDTLTIVRDFENITGQSGGFAYDGIAATVFVHLRWTAASAGGMLQKSGNLSGLADNAAARTNIGLGNVTNTSDANKPVSTAQQAALDAKAPTASPSFTGNVSLTSSGARILGDFSNATVANRVAFQSSVVNGNTVLVVVPNGTAKISGTVFYNGTDPDNAQRVSMSVNDASVVFASTYSGAPGAALPIVWSMAGVERMRLLPTGEVGIGVTPAVGKGTLQVPDINGGATSGFKNKIINGCCRISRKGSGAAALGWNYFGADGIGTYIGGWSAVTGTINTESSATDAKTSSGADHFVNLSSATGSSGYIAFVARIEAADSLELKDKPITVSARITSWSKQVDSCSIKIYKANAFNNFTTTTVLFTSSEQGPISANTSKDISFTTSIAAADLVNGIQIEVLNAYTSAVSASMHLFIADLQCRQSSKVEPFELRPIAIEEQLRQRYYRKQAVWIGTSTARTCFPIDMVKTPTLSGGGTGFTSTGTDKDTFVAYQTTAALQTITLDAEL